MILESTPWLGGMLTSAGVCCIDGNYKLQSGLFGEFADSLARHYGGWEALKSGWVSHINFEPNVGQDILSSIAQGCSDHLTVIREAAVTVVKKNNDGWRVEYSGLQGRNHQVQTSVLIDGTELGDLAKACGVDYRIGMDSRYDTGESIAPEKANDAIQDLTFVALLKDYGPEADMTIEKPEGYDPTLFYNSAINPNNTVSETGQTIWSPQMMITYGRTPNGRYMINWPIYGNDYYANTIEMSPQEREAVYKGAKNFTLCFLYFIQTELGMRNLGLADDVFPTEDKLAFFPYHRESRRIVGEAFFTMDAAAQPYFFEKPYYRTGIAVGDYAVDHHHFRHPDWKSLPDLHFYPIPSFNVPMGVILPKDIDNLIVAEKSISVSNIINGATRLQPVVMQLGQAAGALAAIAVNEGVNVKSVGVRQVQKALLEDGCYIMPYLDLPVDHPHFKALQRIGATGILRGEGRNVGWSNQTWFRSEEPLLGEEVFMTEYYGGGHSLNYGPVSINNFLNLLEAFGADLSSDVSAIWATLGLEDYNSSRQIIRREAAALIDALLNPFEKFAVDYSGALKF